MSAKRSHLAQANYKNDQKIKKILTILVMLILAGQAIGLQDNDRYEIGVKYQQDEKPGENVDDKKKEAKEYLLLSEAFQLTNRPTLALLISHTPIRKSPFITTYVTPPDA